MDIKKMKDDIKGVFTEYNKIFEIRKKENYKEICEGLKPYETVPDPKNITEFKGTTRDYLTKDLTELRTKGLDIVDSSLKELNDYKTQAPDPNAMNYINMLASRKRLTTNDLDMAVQKYGDNYSCYKALEDISSERHIPMNYRNNADEIETVLNDTRRSFDNINVHSCEQGNASAGAVAFQNMLIDGLKE